MKLIKYYLAVLIVFSSGCALIQKPDQALREKMLTDHLHSWEKFRAEGVIEMNIKEFAFRKNIIIQKNKSILRVDILDSGFLGMNPSPFFSLYLDSTLVVRPPYSKEVVSAADAGMEIPEDFTFPFDVEDLFQKKKMILAQRYLEFPDFNLYFSDKMQISKIDFAKKNVMIELNYAQNLERVTIWSEKKQAVNIQFDKFNTNNVEIIPLK